MCHVLSPGPGYIQVPIEVSASVFSSSRPVMSSLWMFLNNCESSFLAASVIDVLQCSNWARLVSSEDLTTSLEIGIYTERLKPFLTYLFLTETWTSFCTIQDERLSM